MLLARTPHSNAVFIAPDWLETFCCLEHNCPKLRVIFQCALGYAVDPNVNNHRNGRVNDISRGNDSGQGKCCYLCPNQFLHYCDSLCLGSCIGSSKGIVVGLAHQLRLTMLMAGKCFSLPMFAAAVKQALQYGACNRICCMQALRICDKTVCMIKNALCEPQLAPLYMNIVSQIVQTKHEQHCITWLFSKSRVSVTDVLLAKTHVLLHVQKGRLKYSFYVQCCLQIMASWRISLPKLHLQGSCSQRPAGAAPAFRYTHQDVAFYRFAHPCSRRLKLRRDESNCRRQHLGKFLRRPAPSDPPPLLS